jgi:hypothetical protein
MKENTHARKHRVGNKSNMLLWMEWDGQHPYDLAIRQHHPFQPLPILLLLPTTDSATATAATAAAAAAASTTQHKTGQESVPIEAKDEEEAKEEKKAGHVNAEQ